MAVTQNSSNLALAPNGVAPGTVLPLSTVTLCGSSVNIPIGIRIGSRVRITALLTNSATLQTLTHSLRYGTTGTNADASLVGGAIAVGTAAVGGALVVAEFVVLSATTASASIQVFNGGTTAGTTGLTTLPCQTLCTTTTATISTSVANLLGLYLSDSIASVITVRSVTYEVAPP